MCKTFPCANLGNPATGAALRTRNINPTINQRIHRAPGVLPGGQINIPGSDSSEQSYFQVANRQVFPTSSKQRWNIFETRFERDIDREEQNEKDLGNKPIAYAAHPSPYLNHADSRNYVHGPAIIPVNPSLGLGVDLRSHLSEAYNQLAMKSCVSHAVAGAFEFAIRKAGRSDFIPSRLFIWYYARLNSGYRYLFHEATNLNIGTSVEDALRVLPLGVCSEHLWPYIFKESNDGSTYKFSPRSRAANEPSENAKHLARQTTATYEAIEMEHSHHKLIDCLDSGFPFIFSMSTRDWLYKKNLNEGNGYQMQVPKDPKSDKNANDWHAFLAVGYEPRNHTQDGFFIIRNSWGTDWGDYGHFYMAYRHMRTYCRGFWTVR